jgi:hypothetical protein
MPSPSCQIKNPFSNSRPLKERNWTSTSSSSSPTPQPCSSSSSSSTLLLFPLGLNYNAVARLDSVYMVRWQIKDKLERVGK